MTTVRLALSGARLAATTAAAAAQVAIDGLVAPRADREPTSSPNGSSTRKAATVPEAATSAPSKPPAAPAEPRKAPPSKPAATSAPAKPPAARAEPRKTPLSKPASTKAAAPPPAATRRAPAKPAPSGPAATKAKASTPPAAKQPEPEPKLAAWVEPVDGACPLTHPVKANVDSGIFHVEGGLSYERVKPDRCYITPAAAEADGLRAAKR